jgi:hypothetical protein
MVITFVAPAQKVGRASKTPGSVLNRHNLQKWVSFQSASTNRVKFDLDPFGIAAFLQVIRYGSLVVNCFAALVGIGKGHNEDAD